MTDFKISTVAVHQFLMVLSSDHVSGATGKSPTVKLGKNGTTGVGASGAVAEVDSTNLPGVYSISFTVNDLNTLGSLSLAATASGCDPTNETHYVRSQIFTDLQLSSGRALIANNLQQNTALNGFTFPMVSSSTGQLLSGLTVTAQRTIAGAGFAPCANSVTEIAPSTGIYTINLAASDLNGSTSGLLFTATNANTLFVPLVPTS